VCHHRPYYVAKSTKDIWYIMRCQISSYGWVCGYRWTDHGRGYCSCSWRRVEGVMGEAISYLWYVRSSTCALSMHDQVPGRTNCANYVADSDITVAALIEAINCLTTYPVSYGKAWRAKEHALPLLWGD
jgi:hypothetical protein